MCSELQVELQGNGCPKKKQETSAVRVILKCTSVAYKILKCMNKVEPSRESAMLSGCLPGHSRRMHRDRTELFSGDLGMRSPGSKSI